MLEIEEALCLKALERLTYFLHFNPRNLFHIKVPLSLTGYILLGIKYLIKILLVKED